MIGLKKGSFFVNENGDECSEEDGAFRRKVDIKIEHPQYMLFADETGFYVGNWRASFIDCNFPR